MKHLHLIAGMPGMISSNRASETPPSSQALQRRLIVDRKRCVYSDMSSSSNSRRGSVSDSGSPRTVAAADNQKKTVAAKNSSIAAAPQGTAVADDHKTLLPVKNRSSASPSQGNRAQVTVTSNSNMEEAPQATRPSASTSNTPVAASTSNTPVVALPPHTRRRQSIHTLSDQRHPASPSGRRGAICIKGFKFPLEPKN